MTPAVEYHCLDCLEGTVTRDYDVSHLKLTCDECGEFGRFVNGGVLEQFRAFEESPPEDFEWERLDRMEKFLVAERIVRAGHSLEDFEITVHDDTDDEGAEGTDDVVAAEADGEVEADGEAEGDGA